MSKYKYKNKIKFFGGGVGEKGCLAKTENC